MTTDQPAEVVRMDPDPIDVIARNGLTVDLHPQHVVEPADESDFPHLTETGTCLCDCPRCTDVVAEVTGVCVCPDCCDLDSEDHPHRSVAKSWHASRGFRPPTDAAPTPPARPGDTRTPTNTGGTQ